MKQSESRLGGTRSNHPRKGVAALCGLFLAFLLTACASADQKACALFWEDEEVTEARVTADDPDLREAMRNAHPNPTGPFAGSQTLGAVQVHMLCEALGYEQAGD